jgi:hypothetical protein
MQTTTVHYVTSITIDASKDNWVTIKAVYSNPYSDGTREETTEFTFHRKKTTETIPVTFIKKESI